MKTNQREKLLVIGAALAIGLLAGDSYVRAPLYNLWHTRSERIQKLKQDLSKGDFQLGRERLMQTTWDRMKTNTLPADVTAAENKLQRAVDQWERASKASVNSIKTQWKKNSDEYTTLECQADAVGSMQAIARFLYEMERDPLALKIEDIDITARDINGQQLALALRFSGLQLVANPK